VAGVAEREGRRGFVGEWAGEEWSEDGKEKDCRIDV